eukprot:9499303-Pyramimonas_sp.AAC.1
MIRGEVGRVSDCQNCAETKDKNARVRCGCDDRMGVRDVKNVWVCAYLGKLVEVVVALAGAAGAKQLAHRGAATGAVLGGLDHEAGEGDGGE